MSTVKASAPIAPDRQEAGLGLEQERRPPAGRAIDGIVEHRPGDAARAVAAGAGFRAVGVVDAQEGVGAGRPRIVQRP